MSKIFIYTTISIFLLGCGDDKAPDEKMIISQLYTMKSGDKVKKTSNIAKIRVMHTDRAKESVIELIEGNATISRK